MKFYFLLSVFLIALSFDLSAIEYKAYDFKDLSLELGFPDKTYFGSNEEEILDLETYTSKEDTFYKEINSYLRMHPDPYEWFGISPDRAAGIVENIDKIYLRAPALPMNLILFRGMDLKYRKNKSYRLGEEFIEKGYASTTTSLKVAHYFATIIHEDALSKKAIFVLYQNQADQKGILIDQEEDEVILNRGQKFRVMKIKKNRTYETYLVQICKKICEQKMNFDIKRFWSSFK